MGYTLEIYQLGWYDIGKALGGGGRELFDRVVRENEARFFAGAPGDSDEPVIWRKIVEAFVCGRRGEETAGRGPEFPGEEEALSGPAALAVAAIIATIGEPIGRMEHSSAGGEMFRRFIEEEAFKALQPPFGLGFLLDRPLFGMTHDGFPSWGGLKYREIKDIVSGRSISDLPDLEDSDLNAWLFELFDLLETAYENESYIVTVYW